ncbi:MAG TPA: DUF4245 domain-containing protein [Acidothermaceae bacterium]|nr:DUF4245 domain-containing protein [Acidothermaceae bacterium]
MSESSGDGGGRGNTLTAMTDLATSHAQPPGSDEPSGGSLRQVLKPNRRSVAVAAVAVLAVAVALFVVLPRPHAGAVQVVDPGPAIAKAKAVPGFAVYTPSPLPAGWYPNSVRFDRAKAGPHLHIGYLAPDHGYVGIEEAHLANSWRFVTTQSAGAVFKDLITIDGDVWAHVQSDRKVQDTLVWYGPSSVVVVTGTASMANLKALAASLHVGR